MGDNLDNDTTAMPVHNVQVDGFFMDKTEVTKELWQSVQTWANNNGYSIGAGAWKDVAHPALSMSWCDAVKWCNARSQKEGLTSCYYTDSAQTLIYKDGEVNIDNTMVKWTANGYRLPTEAEWEKAARGGATGLRFPWGDTITHSQANYFSSNSFSYDVSPTGGYHPTYAVVGLPFTSPVGSFAANGYGLFDMAGNLAEWCWDWHSDSFYGTPASLSNPNGPDSGSGREIRGGFWVKTDWFSSARNCRVANRGGGGPTSNSIAIGFRSVRR